jgi:hypothetical protein
MRRVIRTKHSGQVLGSVLCLVGFVAFFTVFWKAWPDVSTSQNIFSSLWSYILTEEINIASLVRLRLTYLTIMGMIFLSLGILVLALSRQIFYLSGGSVLLKCTYCKNQWRASRAKGWAECPHCRQFIQPEVVKKKM